MHYHFIAIPDADVPQAVEPIFQHVVTTYASEANKTASVWRAVPDALLDFKPHEKTNPIRTILVHQLLSERRFFVQFVGTEEPPVEELLPSGELPRVQEYIAQIIHSRVQQTETCGSPQQGRNFRRWRLLQGRRPPYPQVRMPNFGGLWMANRSGWIGGKRGRR